MRVKPGGSFEALQLAEDAIVLSCCGIEEAAQLLVCFLEVFGGEVVGGERVFEVREGEHCGMVMRVGIVFLDYNE